MDNNNNQDYKILEVRDLRISFRTPGGMLKAVRGINYHLNHGETLAIVGESGSGKSVTSRALLGISAGNAVIESGEMIFDGQDLLRITEDDFHKIRGEKISMIFQDPLSSLNPIIKIGKQLTEAMVIKGKAKQKEASKLLDIRLSLLREYMDRADFKADGNDKEFTGYRHRKLNKYKLFRNISDKFKKLTPSQQANKDRIEKFYKFELKHCELEGAYNIAKESIKECIDEVDYLVLLIEKDVAKNSYRTCYDIKRLAEKSINTYLVTDADKIRSLTEQLISTVNSDNNNLARVLNFIKRKELPNEVCRNLLPILKEIRGILAEADALTAPSFFAMGYYLTFCDKPLPDLEISELNDELKKYLKENYMNDFVEATQKAINCSFARSLKRKKEVLAESESFRNFLIASYDVSEILRQEKIFSHKVEKSINKLALVKDSVAYTFKVALANAIKNFFSASKKNAKAEAKHLKEMQKYNRLKENGKNPSYEPEAPSLIDLSGLRDTAYTLITRLEEKYKKDIDSAEAFNVSNETIDTIDFLRAKAAAKVYKVTKGMAKLKALKIMDEVGIPEPRKRFNQYPFEFSGGMRQRIVIAIALTANPSILVCDEPTTALDVTIQAQILELINKLKKEHNLSVIFITHDLGVVANMADRIAVMYAGKVVEYGTAEEVFYSPAHPYTWALLSSMPDLETTERLESIHGTPPDMLFPPKGDAFALRNKYAMKIDFEKEPPMFKITDTHYAATWLLHPDAPKVELPPIVRDRINRNLAKAKLGEKNLDAKIKVDEANQSKVNQDDKEKADAEIKNTKVKSNVKKKAVAKKATDANTDTIAKKSSKGDK